MAITNNRNKGMEINIKNVGTFLIEEVSPKAPWVRGLLLNVACCM